MSHPLPTGYREARLSVAYFRSARARLTLTGKDVQDFLHRMSTNDLQTLPPGEDRMTVFTSEKGRVVDMVHVTGTGEGATLTASAGNGGALSAWLERFIIMEDVRITDCREEWQCVHLMGPDCPSVVTRLRKESPRSSPVREDMGSIPGFLLPPDTEVSQYPEMDKATYETLRVEEGVPAFAREITEEFNPLESGLKKYVSFSKGCYIGQEVIARLDTYRKLQKVLTIFEFPGHTGPKLAPGKLSREGIDAGIVTSTVFSPSRGGWIGLGYRRLRNASKDLVMNTGEGSTPVHARILKGLPEEYESYEITEDAEQAGS